MTPTLTASYVKLIADLDGVLSLTRTLWMQARDPKEKRDYLAKLNGLLDQRLTMMAARDAGKA